VRVGLPVVHHEVGAVELAARAEVEQLPVYRRPEEGDPGVAERTVRHDDGHTGEVVVHDLMPHQDPDRVRLRDVVDLDRDHRLLERQEPDLTRRQESGVVDGRDAVRWNAAGDDLLRVDERSLDRQRRRLWPVVGSPRRTIPPGGAAEARSPNAARMLSFLMSLPIARTNAEGSSP
jgi:hypothetical protein